MAVSVAQDNQGKSLLIIYIEQGRFTMAAQAKGFRQVKKEELEACIEDAKDAIGNARDKKLRTNIVRTLMTRKNALTISYEAWNKACGDYSIKQCCQVGPYIRTWVLNKDLLAILGPY